MPQSPILGHLAISLAPSAGRDTATAAPIAALRGTLGARDAAASARRPRRAARAAPAAQGLAQRGRLAAPRRRCPAARSRRRRPCLAASSRRRSGWPTQRSSPVSPSSPKHAARACRCSGDARGWRSRPPARPPGRSPARPRARRRRRSRTRPRRPCRRAPWRPRIASTSARRLRSRPETTRRGCSSSEGATSAWTSTSSGREPSIAASTTLPGGARGLGDEARGGVEHLHQAALAHLEQARLVGRAEAVLQRAQLAVGALALALELQHAVDQVLEHARPGQRAVLGHVPDQDHRHPPRLGQLHDPRGHLAHLPDRARARRTARPRRSVCTESITHASGASAASVSSTASRSVSARIGHLERGLQRPLVGIADEPLGAQPHLLGGLLAADVQRAVARLRRWPSTMFVSVDLPIPGEPPSSTSEPGTSPPPSTRSSSPMPVDMRSTGAAPTSRSGAGRARARPAAPGRPHAPRAARPRAAPRACRRTASSTSVFQASQPGHWPCHLADWKPHSEQTWTVVRAIEPDYAYRRGRAALRGNRSSRRRRCCGARTAARRASGRRASARSRSRTPTSAKAAAARAERIAGLVLGEDAQPRGSRSRRCSEALGERPRAAPGRRRGARALGVPRRCSRAPTPAMTRRVARHRRPRAVSRRARPAEHLAVAVARRRTAG